jgi:hypothetical protein
LRTFSSVDNDSKHHPSADEDVALPRMCLGADRVGGGVARDLSDAGSLLGRAWHRHLGVAPWLGATTLPAMVIRHGALFLAVIVGIPFAVSSPKHSTFWVLLAALLFVLLPFVGAMGWFYGEIRRLQQERKIRGQPPTTT